jgi:hypothetical protein
VCEFKFHGLVPEQQTAALGRLREGLGFRCVEGFGILAVQPNWLFQDQPIDAARKEAAFDSKPQWPDLGMLEEDLGILRGVLRSGPLTMRPELAVTLAAQSTHLPSLDAVQEFARKSKELSALVGPIGEFRRQCPNSSLQALQYWLRACASLSRTNKDRESGRGGAR